MASSEIAPSAPTGGLTLLRALRYRNYRLFFGGQGISLIGTWMQQIAMSWLVYRLSNSAFWLGIVGFSGQIPAFLFAPFAGVLADRWNRRRMLIGTQTCAMIQAFIIAILTLTGVVEIWHIVVLSVFLGVVNAFDIPTRQTFVLDMVERKEDVGNAIALNSSLFNGARLVGPSIAGVLIAAVGEGICFLINGLSYIAVIMALRAIRIKAANTSSRAAGGGKNSHVLHDMKEGFAYAFGFAPIKSILLLLAFISLVGMPYAVLMPVFARDILHGGPHTLGFLMGGTGVGALMGAAFLASRRSIVGLGKWIVRAVSILGCGLIAFAASRVVWLSLIMMVFVGFGMMVQMASSNTLLQTIAEDSKRGRVMSLYTMAFMGMAPFGSLLAGVLASAIGAPDTLLLGGVCCIVAAVTFAKRLPALQEIARPVAQRPPILPPSPSPSPTQSGAGESGRVGGVWTSEKDEGFR